MTAPKPTASDRIQLLGLRATGTHGVLDEEKLRAQPFEVDLDLYLDLRRAGASDDLAHTVDYGAVAAAVASTIEGPHADLLEHLAERIARAAVRVAAGSVGSAGLSVGAARIPVESVTVTIRKLRPPVPVDLAAAGVTIHRRRAELEAGGDDPGFRREAEGEGRTG